ncbi:MAG TPA: thioesterase family protein [Acidimicrobiales bacterium]|nr:thioesterase family protein [Acidimicrobiales bacterium]
MQLPSPNVPDENFESAYYVRQDETFVSTVWTRGPWDPQAQHAGPPAALVAQAMDRLDNEDGRWSIARFTMEILRPIPVAPLTVLVEVVRPGGRVRLCRGVISANGLDVATAAAWYIRSPDPEGEVEAVGTPEERWPSASTLAHPPPTAVTVSPLEHPLWEPSYLGSLEWRFVTGHFDELGPAVVWARMQHPLIHHETISPLARVLVLADSGNGISAVLPLATSLFINVELSVHLVALPAGEWVCLDAATRIGSANRGLAFADLWGENGWIGRSAQALLVGSR